MGARQIAFALSLAFSLSGAGCTGPRKESFAAYATAAEDPWTLWVAIHKGFHGNVFYAGSAGSYSYFRAGRLH